VIKYPTPFFMTTKLDTTYSDNELLIARSIWDNSDQYLIMNHRSYRSAFGMEPDDDDFSESGVICGFEMFHKFTGKLWNQQLFRSLFTNPCKKD
jgi:hypothetical protein